MNILAVLAVVVFRLWMPKSVAHDDFLSEVYPYALVVFALVIAFLGWLIVRKIKAPKTPKPDGPLIGYGGLGNAKPLRFDAAREPDDLVER